MEDLSFLLKLCLHVRVSIEGGESLRLSLSRFVDNEQSLHHLKLKEWLNMWDQNQSNENQNHFRNHYTQIFLDIISQGLIGHAIYERLKAFEEEIIEICKSEFEKELDKLPYTLMIPLLLFMFPAYLLLLLGPILNLFIQQL